MEATGDKKTVLEVLYGMISKIRGAYINNRVVKALKLDKSSNVYCVYFSVLFFYYYFKTTTITIPTSFDIGLRSCVGILYCIAWFKMIVLDTEDKWDLVRYMLPTGIAYAVFQAAAATGGWKDLMVYFFLIVSARKVDFRRIALTALVIGSATTLIVSVLSPLGLFTNLIYGMEPPYHYTFGFVYPTDYGAHICFLCLLFFWLRKGRLELLDFLIYAGLAAFILTFCFAKTDTICIVMIILAGLAFRFEKSTGAMKKCGTIAVMAIPVLAAVTIILTVCYNENNSFYQFLMEHFRSFCLRFEMGHRVMLENGLSVFGKQFLEEGLGNKSNEELLKVVESQLTFIDISYMKILLRMGIAALAAVCIGYPSFIAGRLKKNDLVTAAVWLIIAVNCASAHHFVDLSYNVFLFMLFADLSGYDKKPSPPYRLMRHKA